MWHCDTLSESIVYKSNHPFTLLTLTLSVENIAVGSLPVKSLPVKSLSTIVILYKNSENQHNFRFFFMISNKFVPNFYHLVTNFRHISSLMILKSNQGVSKTYQGMTGEWWFIHPRKWSCITLWFSGWRYMFKWTVTTALHCLIGGKFSGWKFAG
jgi:hypothetical protein